MRPSTATASPPMTSLVRNLTARETQGRIFRREVIPRGTLCHENYCQFMTGELHATLAPVLADNPRYTKLLDRIANAEARVTREMEDNASGKNYSSWLPGARAADRRELTVAHYMTAIADELGQLSKRAASNCPSRFKRDPSSDVEIELLEAVAGFLNEFKRSVRSASIAHVNRDYSAVEARRIEAMARDGVVQPGQEKAVVSGASIQGGAGLDLGPIVKLNVSGVVRQSDLSRHYIDYDRDNNHFEESGVMGSIATNAGIFGVFNVGASASFEYAKGMFHENPTVAGTLEVANLSMFRNPGLFGATRSAGKSRRQLAETGHGLGLLARKVFGGGKDRPYDPIKWAGRAKEEKGKYNRTLLQDHAATIERLATELARLKGIKNIHRGMGAASAEYFPTVAEQIERYRTQTGIETGIRAGTQAGTQPPAQRQSPPISAPPPPTISTAIGMPSELLSVPAMLAKPGDPRKKKPYTSVTATVAANATLGFHPLVTAVEPAGFDRVLVRFKNFLPSASAAHSCSHNRRVLDIERQAPISEALAPKSVIDFDKGIDRVDAVAMALHAGLPADSAGPVRLIDYAHPAFAVLRRYESPAYQHASPYPDARGPYLATMSRLAKERSVYAPDWIERVARDMDAFRADYQQLVLDSHAAKEARRCGDRARLDSILRRMNARHWSGWMPIAPASSLDKLDAFIGQTLAQHHLAFVRMKYEATLAKMSMSGHVVDLTEAHRAGVRQTCLQVDRLSNDIDEMIRELKPPLLQDTAAGFGFYSNRGVSARKLSSSTSSFTVTAGLPAAVAAVAQGVTAGAMRGPEVQVSVTQAFNDVIQHPNLLRAGRFYTLTFSLKAGAGARTCLLAAEAALRKGQKSGKLSREFVKAASQKLKSDIDGLFSGGGDALAAVGRSSGLVFELSYGQAHPLANEKPAPYLRYIKVLGQTTYDNGVRTPNLLTAAAVPGTLSVSTIDTSNRTGVRRTLHGNNARHLLLEYTGPGGLKSVIEPRGDAATIDFEAVRLAFLKPANDEMREAWFHGNSPFVDIVEKYAWHLAQPAGGPVDPSDEFAYIDLDGEQSSRIEQGEPHLRRFAAGSEQDPFVHEFAQTRRQALRAQAGLWPRRGADEFRDLRARLTAMHSDHERVEFMTRHPDGQALLQQAVSILDGYGAWAGMLRTVVGYGGSPNMASIDLLRLRRPPVAPQSTAGGFQHLRAGRKPENCWL